MMRTITFLSSSLIFVINLLYPINSHHLLPPRITYYYCKSNCLLPYNGTLITLPASYPPCLHPGLPVLLWSKLNENCKLPVYIKSKFLSFDQSGLVFAEKRICLFEKPWHIEFFYKCSIHDEHLQSGYILFDHQNFITEKRIKRWLRRRNPNLPRIHFQQERYITEIPENTPVGSIVIQLHAKHITDQPLFYAMVAPEDSRSANIFTLDTVSGEIR